MKRTAVNKTFALLLLATAMTLGTTVEAKNPNPTPCSFNNKEKRAAKSQAEWYQELNIYRKFVKGYELEKQRYEKSNPRIEDWEPSQERERREYFNERMLEVDRRYKERIRTEDPNFYRVVENGPDGWYESEEHKETWRTVLWSYLAIIGWYKDSIKSYADTGETSLAGTIAKTETWKAGRSREADRVKKLTLGGLKEVRSNLHKQLKRLDELTCPGPWEKSKLDIINGESYKAYALAVEVQRHNAGVFDQEVNNADIAEQAAIKKQIQSDPTMRYLLDYFSSYRTVGPFGFNCTWGIRGEFSCGKYNKYGLLQLYSSGPRR